MAASGGESSGDLAPAYAALARPSRRASARTVLSTTLDGLRIVWKAARRDLLGVLALQIVSAVAIAAQLLVGRRLLDALVVDDQIELRVGVVVGTLVALAFIAGVAALSDSVQTFRRQIVADLTTRFVMEQIVDVASTVTLEAYDHPDFHDALMRARVSGSLRPWQLASGLLGVTSGLSGLLSVAAVLATLSPLLLPLALAGCVPMALASVLNGRASFRLNVSLTEAERRRLYFEHILSHRDEAHEIRGFQLGPLFRARHSALYELRISRLREHVGQQTRRSLVGVVSISIGLFGAVLFLINMAADGRITVTAAVVAVVAVQQLTGRLRTLNAAGSQLYECSLFLSDLSTFAEIAAKFAPPPAAQPPSDVEDDVVVKDVYFRYPAASSDALRGASMRIGSGEVVALVGENGSGKTTLAKVIAGLYRPTSGLVQHTADGPVSILFQDFVHYELTAAENIGVGDAERVDDQLRIATAAARAGVENLLAALPQGFDTLLSPTYVGGTDLSLGQWQRVALARALMRDRGLLILDEPTSALDPEAEREAFGIVRESARERSVLLVSHRFSTVKAADRIYVMDHGEIVEEGSHSELLAQDGRYARMYRAQADALLDAPASGSI